MDEYTPRESDCHQEGQQLASRTRTPKTRNEKRPMNEGPGPPPEAKYTTTIYQHTVTKLTTTTTVLSVDQGEPVQSGDGKDEIRPNVEHIPDHMKHFHKNPSTTPSVSVSADILPETEEGSPPSPMQDKEFPLSLSKTVWIYKEPLPCSSEDPHAAPGMCSLAGSDTHSPMATDSATHSQAKSNLLFPVPPVATDSSTSPRPTNTQASHSAGQATQHHISQTTQPQDSQTAQSPTGQTTQPQDGQSLSSQNTQPQVSQTAQPHAGQNTQPLASISSHPSMSGLQTTGRRGLFANRRHSDPTLPASRLNPPPLGATSPTTNLAAASNVPHSTNSTSTQPTTSTASSPTSTTNLPTNPDASSPADSTTQDSATNSFNTNPSAGVPPPVTENKPYSTCWEITHGSTTTRIRTNLEMTVKEEIKKDEIHRTYRTNSVPTVPEKPETGNQQGWTERVVLVAIVLIIVVFLYLSFKE